MILPADRRQWPAQWLQLFEERAGIMTFEGGMSQFRADREAEQDIRKIAAKEHS